MKKILTIVKNFFKFKKFNAENNINLPTDILFDDINRDIKYIVIHCTATSQNTKIENIVKYWKYVMGWEYAGYHYIIEPNGTLVNMLRLSIPSNGVKGYNKNSINISYIGGVDKDNKPIDNRTIEQKNTMLGLVKTLKGKFPNAIVLGHRDFPDVKKDCPSFNVQEWLKTNNL
jgi:N-acetylmuramoyl-L-alanine amidase